MAEATATADPEFADVAAGLAAADAAASREATDEALHIWARLRAEHPAEPAAFLRAGVLLTRLGRLDEAAPLLADAQARFPADAEIAMALARIGQARRDWPEAGRRWADVLEQFPHIAAGYAGAAAVLRETGNPELAQSLLRQAIEQFPEAPEPLLAHADEAAARGDRRAEVERLAEAHDRLPQEPRIAERLAEARARMPPDGPSDAVTAPGSAEPAEAPAAEPAPVEPAGAEPAPAQPLTSDWERLKTAPPPVPRASPPRRGLLQRLFGRS